MGGGKKQTIGHKYFLGVHMILCHGPIDKITKIQIDKKTAWLGVSTGGQITINKPTLFGGDEKEGGISGTLDIEMGENTQLRNSYLESVLGPIIPAYRRLVGVVLRQMYLGTSPYLKEWSFRGTRILKADDGEEQWYPEKAVIPVDLPPDPILVTEEDSWEISYSYASFSMSPPSKPNKTGYGSPSPGPFSRDADTSPGTVLGDSLSGVYWLRKTITVESESLLRIHGSVENSCAIYFDNEKVLDENPDNDQVLGDTFSVDVVATSGSHTIHIYFRDEFPILNDNASVSVEVEIISTVQEDMNPAHVIREVLTNKTWGMGYLDSDMDDVEFVKFADALYEEKLGISLLWDRSMTIEDFSKEVNRHIDASLYVSRVTGKFVPKLIRKDYDVEDLIHLNPDNVSSVSNPNRTTAGELSNSVTVKFWNYKTGKDDSVTVSDTALARIQGDQLINASVNYPGFSNKRNAIIACQRDLRSLSIGFFSCTLIADKTAKNLNPGDAFLFSWPEWHIFDMVMRVSDIAFGDGKNNKVRITCSEDIYATSTNPQVIDSGSQWVDPSAPPGLIENQIVFEAPYFEIVQNFDQASVDDSLENNPEAGYVMAAASRPFSAIDAKIWTDSGSGYEEAGILDFCPFGSLSELITKTQTTIVLENFIALDEVEIGTFAQIGETEIVRIDSVNTANGEVTIGRGCLDTTPKEHYAGVKVFFWDLYSGYDVVQYSLGETVDVSLTAVTGQGQLDVTSADEMSITLNQRAFRPYPPGQFQINTEYYPEEVLGGVLSLTWADRDRKQQTSGDIYDHTFGDIGPEDGTEYRVQGYFGNTLVHTEEPASSGTTWTPTIPGYNTVEIHSKRDGVYSLFSARHEFYYTFSSIRVTEGVDEHRTQEDDGDVRLTED